MCLTCFILGVKNVLSREKTFGLYFYYVNQTIKPWYLTAENNLLKWYDSKCIWIRLNKNDILNVQHLVLWYNMSPNLQQRSIVCIERSPQDTEESGLFVSLSLCLGESQTSESQSKSSWNSSLLLCRFFNGGRCRVVVVAWDCTPAGIRRRRRKHGLGKSKTSHPHLKELSLLQREPFLSSRFWWFLDVVLVLFTVNDQPQLD